MTRGKKITLYIISVLLSPVLIFLLFLRLQYGGGKEYIDLSTPPIYKASQLQPVIAYHEPIGNVAATKDTTQATRVFFTIHPESRPKTNKLMEVVHGKAIPYPNIESQKKFNTILGVFTDQQNRLWTIDHGNHGFDPVKLTAFDLATDTIVHAYTFPEDIAKKLSFFNDLTVSPNGKYIAISNASFFGKSPSMVIYNIETGYSKNLLENHSSVKHEKYVPVTPSKKMRFLGGVVDLLIGIDGIDFSRDGAYIYYAPMGSSGLYRISTEVVTDFTKTKEEVATMVERVANKPLSDGIRTDFEGNVYITDIEHQGIYIIPPKGKGFTLIKDSRIRWADGLSITNDGTFYLADSDIPNQTLQSKKHITKHAPYYIYKFEGLDFD